MPGEPVGQLSAEPLAAATVAPEPGAGSSCGRQSHRHARIVAPQAGQQCHGPAVGASTPGGAAGGEP